MKYIYLVLSRTETNIGKVIRRFTHEQVNHSGVSFTEDLTELYSFARKRACNCFDGGLVKESPNTLKFGGKKDCLIEVYAIPISNEDYDNALSFVEDIRNDVDRYIYNTAKLVTSAFDRYPQVYKSFVCTEFSSSVLRAAGCELDDEFIIKVTPGMLAERFKDYLIFSGDVDDYPPVKESDYTDEMFFTRLGLIKETALAMHHFKALLDRINKSA